MRTYLVIGVIAATVAGHFGVALAQTSRIGSQERTSVVSDPVKKAWFERAVGNILTGSPLDTSKPLQGRSSSRPAH